MNKLYRKCEYCSKTGVAKEEVFWMPDPYEQDVDNTISMEWLHEECARESSRDI